MNGSAGTGGSGAGEPRGDFAAASAYVGISKAKLHDELSAGRSLAAVAATTPGHSAVGLLEAIMRPRVRRIEAQVAAKRLSKADAQRRIQRIRERVQARLARSRLVQADGRDRGAVSRPLAHRPALAGERRAHALAAGGRAPPKSPPGGLIAAVMAVRIGELVRGAGASSQATLRHETALLHAVERRVRREVQQGTPAAVAAAG